MGPSSPAQPPVSHSSHSSLGYKPTNRNEKDDEKNPDHIAIDIHPTDPPPAPTPLEVFHNALGMPVPKPPKPSRSFFGRKKPATNNPNAHIPLSSTNRGVYKIVLANERNMRWRYYACNISVSVAMFLQIIVGASLTAFGAGSVDHVVITIFGAANTAIASLLAVLKSQGLPNRWRQDWKLWRDLREYIEEQERDIEMKLRDNVDNVEEIDVQDLIRDVEARYKDVRLTLEANRPDSYTVISNKK